jgi:hypothetical protein
MRSISLLKSTDSILTNQSTLQGQPSEKRGPIDKQRRALLGGAVAALLASSEPALADGDSGAVNNPFILLLHGVYEPVAHLPNLGLEGVNLSDPSYMRTRIYPIFGVPGAQDQNNAIGRFYVSLSNPVCVYDLPAGAIAMSFNSSPVEQSIGFNTFVPFPDGQGGNYLEGTFELMVVDATGIYKSFKGGHNHMVDRLHQLANGQFNEYCFCNISQYPFP